MTDLQEQEWRDKINNIIDAHFESGANPAHDDNLQSLSDELAAALQSVHARAVEQTWNEACEHCDNGIWSRGRETTVGDLADYFRFRARNAAQQASHKEKP